MKLLVALLIVLAGLSASARTLSVYTVVDALKKNNQIIKFEPVNIGPPFPNHARERKYFLYARSTNDQLVQVGLFFAERKGTRHVFKLGISLPEGSTLNEASKQALGLVTGYAMTACLGIPGKPEIGGWLAEKIDKLGDQGQTAFQKNFGVLSMAVGREFTGFVGIAVERPDRPGGKGWPDWCVIR